MNIVGERLATLLVAVSIVLTSVAQLLFSFVMKQINADSFNLAVVVMSLSASDILYLGLGIVLYGVSMLAWIVALTRLPLSLAYPMLSISYLIVYVAATCLAAFDEMAGMGKSIGLGLIVIGVSVLFLDERLSNESESLSGESNCGGSVSGNRRLQFEDD